MSTKPSFYSIEEIRRLSGPRLAEMVQAACTLDGEGFDSDVIDYPDKLETYAAGTLGNDNPQDTSLQMRVVLGAKTTAPGRIAWGWAISARGREPGQPWGPWQLGGRIGWQCPNPAQMLDTLRTSAAWRRFEHCRDVLGLQPVRLADLTPTLGELEQWPAD